MAHRVSRDTRPQPRTTPTQVLRPWRATLRAVIVAALALLPLLPEIARAANIDTAPAVVSVLAVVAAIQRVITLPSVDRWLGRYLGLGSADRKDYLHDSQ